MIHSALVAPEAVSAANTLLVRAADAALTLHANPAPPPTT
jgi:hypothetical protein